MEQVALCEKKTQKQTVMVKIGVWDQKQKETRMEGRAQREATRNRRGGEATGGKESGGE